MMHFLQPFVEVVQQLCVDVNTPRSLSVSIMIRYGAWKDLFDLKCDPNSYIDSEDFFKDNLVTDFCRKLRLEDVVPRDVLEQECFERFCRTERTCHETNIRLARFIDGGVTIEDAALFPLLDKMRKIVGDICGPLPDSINGGFGPGATLTNTARRCTVPDKLSSVLSGTKSANDLLYALYGRTRWIKDYVSDHSRGLDVARGNRFFTVPKEATKLRGACLSPSVNGFLQKGVGAYLRKRLTTVGIEIGTNPFTDLYSINAGVTPDYHRQMARQASLDGSLATIDLSDASNTIAFNAIRLLFPAAWFQLLCDLRESWTERPDGRFQKLEMFSAMGNGFTFEVETIVFYAICRSIVGDHGTVSVFGDDIIVPSESAANVLAALRWFGFTPNQRKTFTSGYFRESCGGDFFNGVPVRAHFVKELPREPQEWIAFANGIRRLAYGDPDTRHRWRYLRRCWFRVLDHIPSHIRILRGPVELGDLVIHDEEDRWRPRWSNSIRLIQVYRPVPRRVSLQRFTPKVQFLSALYGVSSNGPSPRGAVSGYKVGWVPFS